MRYLDERQHQARKRLPFAVAVEVEQATAVVENISRTFSVLNAGLREIERPNFATRFVGPARERRRIRDRRWASARSLVLNERLICLPLTLTRA